MRNYPQNHEAALLSLIKSRSLIIGDFVLASGARSNFYIDGKLLENCSDGVFEIGEVLYGRTRHLGMDAIGGIAVGAVPLVTAALMAYHYHGEKMEGFWVRSEPKEHGTKKAVEGNLSNGQRVVIVDDIITSGKSVVKAIAAVKEMNCDILKVISLVDRQAGAESILAAYGCEYEPIFTLADLEIPKNEPREACVTV